MSRLLCWTVLSVLLLCSVLACMRDDLVQSLAWLYALLALAVLLLLVTTALIWRQPKSSPDISFKVNYSLSHLCAICGALYSAH